MSKKITLGVKTKQKIKCSNCGKFIPVGEQFTFRAKDGSDFNACADCKILLDQELAKETENIPYRKALFGGFVGALLGGFLWFIIEFLTGYQIGYVAIGVGYLVLLGIGKGSGNKKGSKLQIIGLLLTLLAIIAAQYFLGVYYIQTELVKTYPDASFWAVMYASCMAAGEAFFSYAITPIGLFIWGIALYVVFHGLRPVKI